VERINVPFKFYEVQSEQGTTETKWTRLDGKDLHNILENLDLKPIFNGVPPQGMMNYRNVKKLWKVTYFAVLLHNICVQVTNFNSD